MSVGTRADQETVAGAAVPDVASPSRLAEVAEEHAGRFVVLITAVWLLFLLNPMWRFRHRVDEPRVLLAYVALVPFCVSYLAIFELTRRLAAERGMRLPQRTAWSLVGVLTLSCVALVVGWHEYGLGTSGYVVIAAPMALTGLAAPLFVLAVSVAAFLTSAFVPVWETDANYLFVLPAIGLVIWGVKQILLRNVELISMRREYRTLLLEQERTRFARDLHDLLGHSLTAMTVKAELASRLLERDPAAAAEQLEDLQRLGREALTDVREAVHGYQHITLPAEITRARMTLEAAGVEARLPSSTDDVAGPWRELFAWAVREGVTNVVRHGHATTCTVELSEHRVVVRNDLGDPAAVAVEGNGLRGLRSRAAALGAQVHVTCDPRTGFVLEVVAAR